MTRRLVGLIPFALLALVLAVHWLDPLPVQQIRAYVFDSYQRLAPRSNDPEASPVVIVDIDDASLGRLGQWPWPRTLVADLVDRLNRAGAAAIALDIVFAEPDRTSPENAVEHWPDTPEVRAIRDLDLPSNDAVLAEALGRGPTITAFAPVYDGGGAPPAKEAPYVFVGDDPRDILPNYTGAVSTLPMLDEAATGHGAINLDLATDFDAVVRRVPLLVQVDGRLYHSLVVEALRVAFGQPSVPFKSTGAQGETAFGGAKAIVAARLGNITVPTDARGRMILHYAGHDPDRFVPAWKVLAGEYDPARFAARIVLVGTGAQGLFDLRSTPLNPSVSGVEVHAEAIEQIARQAWLKRPDWAIGAERGYLVLIGFLIALAVPRVGAAWSAALGAAVLAGVAAASWLAFAELGWLLDPVYPSAGAALAFMASTVLVYLRSDAERRKVRNAFSRYLSPDLVERLAAHPGRLELGGEMREMTLMFCDIRGFTTISEQFDAQELTAFINRFLTPMTDIVLRRRGTIDKYMGDAIMAFWNAPLDDPDHAANACRAALEMVETLDALNERWRAQAEAEGRTFHRVRIGVGLNTGECCVGNMGSEQRFDYSAIGDDVNLASRLEGLTKEYGVDVIGGEKTAAAAPGMAWLALGETSVKGKTAPVRIHALAGDETVAASEAFAELERRHDALMAAVRARREDALPALARACREVAGPRLARCYDRFLGETTKA